MIRFSCPACNVVMRASGQKVDMMCRCLRCGQWIQVPKPELVILADPDPAKTGGHGHSQASGRGHSVLGILSVIIGGVGFIMLVGSNLAFRSWLQEPSVDFKVEHVEHYIFRMVAKGDNPLTTELLLDNEKRGISAVRGAMTAIFTVIVALGLAAFSFLEKARRLWSVIGCAIDIFGNSKTWQLRANYIA